MRSLTLTLLLLCLLQLPASGEELYYLAGEVDGLPRAGLCAVPIPGGVLLLTPDDAPTPSIEGARPLPAPDGWEFFLYQLKGFEDEGRDLLLGKARVLHDAGDGWLVVSAPSENVRELDGVHAEREKLVYIPFTPAIWPGTRTVEAARTEFKEDLIKQLDLEGYALYIQELAGAVWYTIDGQDHVNGDRNTFSSKIDLTYDYFQDRFENLGYPVVRQSFPVGNTTAQNIIAIKTGTVYPDSIIVVGGHLDAIAADAPEGSPAPGAEDNGSGASAVLHLAEIFSYYETEMTVHFIGFGGEEQGLYGSNHYVQQAQANEDLIVAALTMDMIASYVDDYAVMIEGEGFADALMSLVASNIELYGLIPARKVFGATGSDHVPFLRAGIPAFLAIDEDWSQYSHYHRTTDTFNKLEPSLGLAILKGVAGTLVDLTNPLPIPTGLPAVSSAQHGFSLRNEPNPFNPATVIRFELDTGGEVRLELFDVSGRSVRVLQDGRLGAGSHAMRWDGRDSSGRAVGSGVYFYRLRVDDTQGSGRMALVR